MSFRKTFCLLAALVMTFGAGDLFAQEADPRGVRVRLVSPDSATWAGIGKTIKVNVLRLKNLSPILDTVIVALRADTLAPQNTATLTAATFSADSLGLLGTGTGAHRFVDTLTAANGVGSAVDTFKFTFTVSVGDPEASSVIAQAFFVKNANGSAVNKLNNLNTTQMSTVTGFTDPVGDKKFVKVDGLRPVNGSIFDSVMVDTGATTANFTGTTNRAFKIGDQIKLKMHVKNFNAATAQFGIYEVNNTASDSAMYSKTFTAAQVVSATNGVRDSLTVSAGQFTIAGLKNNLRTRVIAFLVDNAGNLSANSSTSATAQGFSQAITYVIDSQAPSVTITHPDSGGDRFTGRTDTSITYRQNSGAVSATTFTLNPLKFSANEGTTARWAITGTDTAAYGGTSSTATASFTTTDSFSASKSTKGGKSFALNVVVTDSVGNKTTASPKSKGGSKNVTHDQIAPSISSLFPQSASLPEDKINNITRHPVFQISEVADTISIRYVQAGTSPPDVATQSVPVDATTGNVEIVGSDINVTVNDSLISGTQYSLQIDIRDLAGNVSFSTLDTLTFDKNFQNPTADSFKIAANEDSVLAGQAMRLTVTAIDSKLTRQASATRKAVTYNKTGVLLSAWSGTDAVTSVTYWGTGVTDNGDGTANLDGINWVVGERTVWIKSNKAVDGLKIAVEDTSTTIVDGAATKVVNFNGGLGSLTVDAADLRKFMVTAWVGGAEVTGVSGAFDVNVIPTDWWGNPSMKLFVGGGFSATTPAGSDSLKLLDTRLTKANSKNLLEGIDVVFSADDGGAGVPSGPQTVMGAGGTFTVVAPNASGALNVSVSVANVSGDSTGASKHLQATGSVTVDFAPHGEEPVTTVGAPAAPANLVIQDVDGDQGHYVMASFPHSQGANSYRIFRELNVTTGLDAETGQVVILPEPMLKWVPWTTLTADHGGDINRAVIPVTDNAPTRWAVSAQGRGGNSTPTAAGKRVFTKESVQQMAQFLGADPNQIVSPEELSEMFMPSADYIQSILGDQEGVVFAALDPDVSSILGISSVPQNIRTQGAASMSSTRTVTAEAVAAVDNMPPAAVEGSADGNTVSWTLSADDRVVGSVEYRGYAMPIAGVTSYEILGGASVDSQTDVIGTVGGGVNTFTLDQGQLPAFLRIDALDLDNRTMGPVFSPGVVGANEYTDADGNRVWIQTETGATPYLVDFEDFIVFAGAFGSTEGQDNYSPLADTDADGSVGFTDFINFAGSFNVTAVGVNGQPIPSAKPVILPPGLNENAEFSLRLGSDRVVAGEIVSVDVSLANVQSLVGFGFTLNYDANMFEFVDAVPADQDLLKSTGGETPVFFKQVEAGVVTIANAVVNGAEVSGGGDIVQLTFRVLQEFEENVRFEVAEGLVFDPNQLSNPAVVAGVLEVQSTPTEFALLQNFPNPFNPETTIGYNLAESADVRLQIYNVVGQVVRTLVAEPQTAGRYQVRWNGMDDRGVPVSSGIYFYQVSAGKFEDVRKLMLLK